MEKSEVKNQVVVRQFGDDKSSLLDHFERLSVEVQLNQAMMRRSLSEPTHVRSQRPLLISQGPPTPPEPPQLAAKRRRGSGFNKVLQKVIKPILRRIGAKKKEVQPDANANETEPMFWKTFSRSVRL